MRTLRVVLLVAVGFMAWNCRPAGAQVIPPSQGAANTRWSDIPYSPHGDPNEAREKARIDAAAAEYRKKRVARDAARLVQLIAELNSSLANVTGEIPPEIIRKAEEIEKLARDVKRWAKA